MTAEKLPGEVAANDRFPSPSGVVIAHHFCAHTRNYVHWFSTLAAARQACDELNANPPPGIKYEVRALRQLAPRSRPLSRYGSRSMY